MRIFHIADVHWRSLSRHDEYREVFSNFIEQAKESCVDHIFIAGDIYHTKTQNLSPEYIEQMNWWFTEMASVAEVHLMLGNHDGNLANLSRQDAISPIVNALNNPKIHLYKQSGNYEFTPGYVWNIFSLFDQQGWDTVFPVKDKVNIACYHGSVKSAKTETGWELDDGVDLSFFDGYDFCLLGDIHLRQDLAFRNGKPWISYPGTTLQQNFAEEQVHGFLQWDIISRDDFDVQFKELPNPKPFITLDVDSNIDEIVKTASTIKNGSRVRIRTKSFVSQSDIDKIVKSVNKINPTEIVYKLDKHGNTSKSIHNVSLQDNLRNCDVLLPLIKEYHSDLSISENESKIIEDLLKGYISSISTQEDVTRNTKWSLKDLKFDNTFGYGEGNHISFEKLTGTVGIFGPNRAGKSSVVGSIMYALFNATDRGPMKNVHVMNARKDHCYARAVVDVSGTEYVIERQTVKSENKKGQLNSSTALNLFKVSDDSQLVDLTQEERKETEKLVRKLIGTPEDFLLTSLAVQDDINQFIKHGSTKRGQFISKFLDLDVFTKVYDLANKDANSIRSQLKLFTNIDESILTKKSSMIDEIEANIDDLSLKIDVLRSSRDDLNNRLQYYNTNIVSYEEIESLRQSISKDENLFISKQKSSDILQTEIVELNNKLSKLNDLKTQYDVSELRNKQHDFNQLKLKVDNYSNLLKSENSILKTQKRTLSVLEEVPCGDQYPTCKFIHDAHKNKQLVIEQENKVNDLSKLLNDVKFTFDQLVNENIQEKLKKAEQILDLEGKVNAQIALKNSEIAKMVNDITNLQNNISVQKKQLDEKLLLCSQDVEDEINEIKSSLSTNIIELKKLESEKIRFASEKGKIISDIEKLQYDLDRKQRLTDELKLYDLISLAFSKKGLPSRIINSKLPIVNAEIAKILLGIVDYTVEIEVDESDSYEIYINYGDSKRIIELGSGMEKMIASIALRVALINISTLPKTDMFIIDEGFGALDESGIESCNRLLRLLREYFRSIIVITHVDGIKDAVDNVLEITKIEKNAKIVYGD